MDNCGHGLRNLPLQLSFTKPCALTFVQLSKKKREILFDRRTKILVGVKKTGVVMGFPEAIASENFAVGRDRLGLPFEGLA